MGTDNKVTPVDTNEAESDSASTPPIRGGGSFKASPGPDHPNRHTNGNDDHEIEIPKGSHIFYAHGKEFRFAKR